MERFSRFILNRKGHVIAIFLVLLLPSFLGMVFTGKNYDILSYLPEDLNSMQGKRLLEEEFKMSSLCLIALDTDNLAKEKEIVSQIEGVEGVERVEWLGDYEDIYVPKEFMRPEIREGFLSGNYTLLRVYLKEDSNSKSSMESIRKIRELIGEDALFGGEKVILSDLQETTKKEMVYYTTIGIVAILILLAMSTTSLIEPILFLLSSGTAILLNLGSNIVKGEVSFITASIAAVMQLGISMDYSIFLLHRFEEEKAAGASPKEAMVSALSKAGMPITASALTTIAGFAALFLMKNGIGPDLGFVLGKGIVVSLLVNMTLLPCLLLAFNNLIEKRSHRVFIPGFKGLSKYIVKLRWVLLAVIVLISIPSFLAQSRLDYYYSSEHYLPETSRSKVDTKKIGELFGATELVYLVTDDIGNVKERELVDQIRRIPVVESVLAMSTQVDPAIPVTFIPEEVSSKFLGDSYRCISVYLATPSDDRRTFEAIDAIDELAGRFCEEHYITGQAAFSKDLAGLAGRDNRVAAIVSTALIALIVAISFKSLSIPILLVLTVQAAIWINLSIPFFQDLRLSSVTPIVINAIQLGATIDYAILFASRYRENLALIPDRREAARQTIEDTGRSILTSALIMLFATIGITFISGIKATGELALMIGRGAVISMLLVITGLPAILILLDGLIRFTSRNWPKTIRKEG